MTRRRTLEWALFSSAFLGGTATGLLVRFAPAGPGIEWWGVLIVAAIFALFVALLVFTFVSDSFTDD